MASPSGTLWGDGSGDEGPSPIPRRAKDTPTPTPSRRNVAVMITSGSAGLGPPAPCSSATSPGRTPAAPADSALARSPEPSNASPRQRDVHRGLRRGCGLPPASGQGGVRRSDQPRCQPRGFDDETGISPTPVMIAVTIGPRLGRSKQIKPRRGIDVPAPGTNALRPKPARTGQFASNSTVSETERTVTLRSEDSGVSGPARGMANRARTRGAPTIDIGRNVPWGTRPGFQRNGYIQPLYR